MSKKAKELRLKHVNEISLCTTFCPPANGLKKFEIIKSAVKKDLYSDLFEELEMPEYGDFTSYLEMWLDDDVNRVAYSAFLDVLFASLQDVVYDPTLDKQGKLDKFKENFNSFTEQYENSVITKSDNGKVTLSLEKNIMTDNKQEKKMSIKEKLQNILAELTKTEEPAEAVEVVEEVAEVIEADIAEVTEDVVEENEKHQETEVEEVAEVQEPELAEEAPKSEEPIQEEAIEEVAEVVENAEETVEEIEAEKTEVQEPELEVEVVKSETELLIEKANQENSELRDRLEKLEKANEEKEVRLEKAELMKEISKDFYGLPKTKEEVVEVIYELNKSAISEETRVFIKESLKSLSDLNKASFEEQGHSEEVDANLSEDEKVLQKSAQLVKEHGIDESQAVLVAKGRKTIEQAIETTKKIRK